METQKFLRQEQDESTPPEVPSLYPLAVESRGEIVPFESSERQRRFMLTSILRNGGPAGRRNCGSPRGLLHVGPDGRRPRSGAGALQHHGPNEPGHRRRLPYGTVAQKCKETESNWGRDSAQPT